ncbi:ninein-like [Bolinopsis microptera]|uniref:ninein-like n=1 Tax=Bolinopsis microptera TaxID=2820187 RepID=UPI0030791A7C
MVPENDVNFVGKIERNVAAPSVSFASLKIDAQIARQIFGEYHEFFVGMPPNSKNNNSLLNLRKSTAGLLSPDLKLITTKSVLLNTREPPYKPSKAPCLWQKTVSSRKSTTFPGFTAPATVTPPNKTKSRISTHNIAPLFPELTDESVTIERVLEVWEEKGLKDSTDRSIIEFLKRVDSMSRGENQIIPQILCYNVEAILTSNEVESDTLRESAIAAFKSVITTLQSNLAQVQYDMDALSVALERRTEELEKNLHEYEIGLDLEHKKSDEKLRVQKEAFRQASLQLEKESELKVEKLNNQTDGIIKRTDKEIKNLKNEEANLKKMMNEQNEDIRLTKKYLHEAQNELIKYDELQDAYKMVVEEYQKLHRAMEEKQRQHCEEQENIDELKRYREETSEENKRLRDQMDELHAKFSACKMKLEKEEKNARNAAKRLKKAQQKLQDQTGDSLAVDKRHQMRQRMSVAVPMFTKEADPSLAPTIDTELEDSLNDEILDSESNNVLELQEEVWRLQEELDNQNFEMERYGRILMKQEEALENYREKENNGENSEDAALPLVEVMDVGEVGSMLPEPEVTIVQERVLESALKGNTDQLGLAKETMKSKEEEIESLMAEKIKKDEEIKYLMEEKENLQEKLENKNEKEKEEKKRKEEEEEKKRGKEEEEDSLQSQLTSLQDQVSLLNGTLELNASEIESLESQLEENGRVISSYEDNISEKQSLLEQCRVECKENIGQLTEQVQKIERERAVDMEQHKYKVKVLESSILKLEEEKTASTARASELAALQEKSLVSGDLIKRLQTTVTDLSVELENTKCALDEAETECTKLKKQGMETENEKEEENQTLNTELVDMKEWFSLKLDTVEKEKTELSLIVSQMKQEKDESEIQVKRIEEKLSELKQVKAESESQVKLQEKKLSELEQDKDESEIQVKLLERKLSEQTQETEAGRVEKSALADELASTQNMLAETSNQLEEAVAHRHKEKGELEHILDSKEGEIETLKSHLDQVENDYEALVDSLNKETDNRVSELQNQLEETAGDISSLKSQLKDLGQQLVVLSGERERFYNDNCKLRVDNERLGEEKELLITKVEEVKAVRDTLELDIEQQVAEYQDMMKCCANLQQQNMSSSSCFQSLKDYIKDLEDASFELNEKTTQLEQAEKEKEHIIQLFEDKIREKEVDLERSILEKSEMEGRAKETEVELCRSKSSNTTLDDVKRSLEQQLTAVIKSLDDLTERYEIENSILEEKVVESINVVKEVQHQAEETLHDQLTEQKEEMYKEFREEMESIREKHESAICEVRDQTSTAMSEFKRKCEKKMREMKERYTEDTNSKEGVISGLREEVVEKSNHFESEIAKLKEIFAQDKTLLINSLSSDKDKLLDKINQISEDKIKQLEETHQKDAEIFGEKLRNLQETCDRFEKEGKETSELLLENTARLQHQIETITEANSKSESAFKLEISELELSGIKKDEEICRLQDKVAVLKENLASKQHDMEQHAVELGNLVSKHGRQVSNLLSEHEKELEDLSRIHEEEVTSLVDKNCDILQEMERKNLSERKCLVSEYNDLIESIKIEQKEEAEILRVRHEEIKRDLQKKNEDLEEEKKESAKKNEDLVATLDESQIVLREKDQEIDILNEEIFKLQGDNVQTLQDHDQELSVLETEREEIISSFKEKETKLLEEVENVRETSFVEIEGTVAEMEEQREMYQDLSHKYEQVIFINFY